MMGAMKKLAFAALLLACACKKKEPPPAAPKVAEPAPPPKAAPPSNEPPPPPVGIADPFARQLTGDSVKLLQKAYKALRVKKWDEAQAGFSQVIASAPDHASARWGLVRTLALSGKASEVAEAYEAVLLRDYVGYATRFDKPKEFAPLRGGPEWARIGETRDKMRDRWAQALAGGFFFVARLHAAAEPKFEGGATESPLALQQEVYHYDPGSKRFHRITDTDGHAFALHAAEKSLTFLVAQRLYRSEGVDAFIDPKLGAITLEDLTVSGPFPVKGRFTTVTLTRNAAGKPLFVLVDTDGNAQKLTPDAAGTALVAVEEGEPTGGQTIATPGQIVHDAGKEVEGVTLTDGAKDFKLEGVANPIVAARPILRSSFNWAPNKLRIAYAGVLDACKIIKAGSKEKNELYVFEVESQKSQRIAAAVAPFSTLWLDDDRVVYEGGVGKDGRLFLYTFSTHASQPLPTRHGAGLFGVPTLACEEAEASDEPAAAPGDEPPPQ
jgi:hypothetical protein